MKIAHVKSLYGPIGGIESMLEGVMPDLDAVSNTKVVIFFVAHKRDADLERRLTANGAVECRFIRWRGLKSLPLVARQFSKELKTAEIDVVHTHDMRANLLAAISKPFRTARWLCQIHGWLGHTHKGVHRFYETIDRRLVRYADHVLVGSYATLEEVRSEGAKSSSVAWNAVVLPAIGGARKAELGLPDDQVIFTILGRLHEGKGQDLFLKALGKISANPHWYGIIVGVGEQESHLKQLAQELGILNRIRFTGFVKSTSPWIAASDVVVVPSRKESLPLTCLEGMAHAKAVIVSNAGDLSRVVTHEQNGLVVPIGDVDRLASAMERLTENPAERKRMGLAARRHVETHHTTEKLAEKMAQAAQNLLSR